jgi:potassium efflux system protein
MQPVIVEGVRLGQSAPNQKGIARARGLTYLVFGGTLMLNLSGYGILSGLWFGAWAEMVTLLFWAWISLNALRELRRDLRPQTVVADEDKPLTLAHYWRWALIQLGRAIWLVGLVAGMLWIGDPSGYFRPQIGQFFNFTVTLGSLNLSIKGIVLAIIIIFITHLASRVGRALLKEKILDKRSLERGLKDSILTITSYLGWGLGLLLALGSLGVDATSLAVIFGALSIGIGFGLQNIFNNFISGLILLFERPIQVGDYVEVGGIWAEIRKINVRATIVQTFDNASLIIPNSEFISQQVTNWSFKDRRMRRSIDIGVAYGSDIDLVQKTLLDIAQETKEILKYPQPDVLFMDHAASALIFRLRIWVNIDDSLRVASQVRCDIDRRFRELGIEIAFPQQDLHIRTIPKEIAAVVSTVDSDSSLTCSQKNSKKCD